VPDGGFAEPEGQWLQRWSVELIIVALTTAGAIWWIAVGIRRRSWVIPLIAGAVAILGGLYFTQRGFILAPYGFYATAAIGAASAALIALRRNRDRPQPAE
jgi:hypothetical protein